MGRRSLESSYTNIVACLSSRFRKLDNGHKNHNNPFCAFHPSTSASTHPICTPSDQELCDGVMKDKKPGKHLSGFRLVQAGVEKGLLSCWNMEKGKHQLETEASHVFWKVKLAISSLSKSAQNLLEREALWNYETAVLDESSWPM